MAIVPAAQLAAARQRAASKVSSNPIFNTVNTVPKLPAKPKAPIALKTIGSDAAQSLGGVRPATASSSGASTIGTTAAAANNVAQPGGTTSYQDQVDAILASLGLSSLAPNVPQTAYQGELTDQPDYQAGQLLFNSTNDAANQARQMAIRRAIIATGLIPDTGNVADALKPYTGDIDQSTIDTARSNQFSTQAQLQRGLDQSTAALPYQLAARGMETSGESKQRGQQLTQDYDLQSNQNLSSLLSTLQGTQGDYGTALTGARSQWDATQRDIADRLSRVQGYNQPTTPGLDLAALLRALGGMFDQGGGDQGGGDQGDQGGGGTLAPEQVNVNYPVLPADRPYVPPTPSPAIMRQLQSTSALTRAKAAAKAHYISVPVSQIRGR